MGARSEVVDFWDHEVARWADGDHSLTPELLEWKDTYQGNGHGAVDLSVFPEPYGGVLNGETPKLIMLGLNPGAAQPEFQSMDGFFTQQIRDSSYSEWAATVPYASEEWEAAKGVNVYLRNRVSFARRLHSDSGIDASQLLFMELYPFHSTRVTSAMNPPAHLLERFVFAPLAEIDVEHIFAFGKALQSAWVWAKGRRLRLNGKPRVVRRVLIDFQAVRI